MSQTPFSLFLALRYLKPKRTFLSVITMISVIGVMLGIAVLILVISVMTGFHQELIKKITGFDAHVVITSDGLLENWQELKEKAENTPGVVAAAPMMLGPVIVEFQGRISTPKIKGVDPEMELAVTSIKEFMDEGEFQLDSDEAVLGADLAGQLGVSVGDIITIYSIGNFENILQEVDALEAGELDRDRLDRLRSVVTPTDLEVTGIFRSGRFQYDSEFIFVPLHIGQELYRLGDAVHALGIKTEDPMRAGEVRDRIREFLVYPQHTMTMLDMNRQFLEAVALERNVMFFLLFFIIIVAAFGIMSTLITVTVQKTREIGILKAVGATTGQVAWVFLAQGMVVGLLGNIAGVGMGVLATIYRNEVRTFLGKVLGIHIFPAEIYQFAEIPAKIVPHDVLVICISAFVICSLAALIPALAAARLDPVKALRQE